LTKNKDGFNKYLYFISSRNSKFSKYAIKINLKIDYIYRNEYGYTRPGFIKKMFHSKSICSGVLFEKEMKYPGYLDCFYVYDFDYIILSNKIYRLKHIGTFIAKLPNNIDRGYFEKEAREYQKHDIYFIFESNLFVFNNSMYNYTNGEIDSILGKLEFVDLYSLNKSENKLTPREVIETEKTAKMYKLLQKSKNINQMSGTAFEQFCKEILINYEWLVNTTKSSGDHGIDIIARKNGKTIGIQCKNYTNKIVSNRAIQEVYTGCHFYDLNIPVIVTNVGFTKQAIQEAKKLNIKLFDIKNFFYFASE
jgi:HJR/Mrr/RecB family endonuclease